MRALVLASFLVLILSAPAWAQNPPRPKIQPPSPTTPKPPATDDLFGCDTTSKRDLALHYLEAGLALDSDAEIGKVVTEGMRVALLDQIIEKILAASGVQGKPLEKEARKIAEAQLLVGFEQFKKDFLNPERLKAQAAKIWIPRYCAAFSEAELEQLLLQITSPLGKKTVQFQRDNAPEATEEGMKMKQGLGQELGLKYLTPAAAKAAAEIEQLKLKSAPPKTK